MIKKWIARLTSRPLFLALIPYLIIALAACDSPEVTSLAITAADVDETNYFGPGPTEQAVISALLVSDVTIIQRTECSLRRTDTRDGITDRWMVQYTITNTTHIELIGRTESMHFVRRGANANWQTDGVWQQWSC